MQYRREKENVLLAIAVLKVVEGGFCTAFCKEKNKRMKNEFGNTALFIPPRGHGRRSGSAAISSPKVRLIIISTGFYILKMGYKKGTLSRDKVGI
jgi:hypothetical protein